MKKNIVKSVMAILLLSFIFSGCMEQRYYRQNNRHSSRYYEKRHMQAPRGVEIELHK